jgi:hypothetical protein
VPDDENKPTPPARQPVEHQAEAWFKGESNVSVDVGQRRKMPRTVMTWGWVGKSQPFSTGGRPTSRDLVRAEARRRLAAGTVPALLKEFGNELSIWLAENHPDAPSMAESGPRSACAVCGAHPAGAGSASPNGRNPLSSGNCFCSRKFWEYLAIH